MQQFIKFVLIRAAMAVFTLILVSFIVFTLMEMVPGDCAERYLAFKNTQGSQISIADIEAERVRLGLDKPYLVRWASWLGNAFQGEFGDSCILRVSINQLLGDKFLISLGLCLTSLLLAYLIAVPVGILSVTSGSATLNNSLRFISYLGLAMPNFLLALILLAYGARYFDIPVGGLMAREYEGEPMSWGVIDMSRSEISCSVRPTLDGMTSRSCTSRGNRTSFSVITTV